MKTSPATYCPTCPAEFVGPAQKLARVFEHKAADLLANGKAPLKILLFGLPGVGKTALANMLAHSLGAHKLETEVETGRKVNIDLVRDWTWHSHFSPMFGQYAVKIVNEVENMRAEAQDGCLAYLDEMRPRHAFIATANVTLKDLTPRFQTRLQQYEVKCPTTEQIIGLLKQWPIRDKPAAQIAVGSGGNVRAALLDAESFLDCLAIK